VTLEALASGVPTVAFDYGAAREFLRDGVHGAAVACCGDHDREGNDFIAALMRIGGDDMLRARMRGACREAVSTLRPARVAADFDRILQSLARREVADVSAAA